MAVVSIAASLQPLHAQVPSVAFVSPPTANVGGQSLNITVTGANFAAGAVVEWNAQPVTTTYVNPNQLTAVIPGNFLASAGTFSVSVRNPDGLRSNSVPFILGPGPVAISTDALPQGVVGSPYLASLAGAGGSPPYSWSANSLPPGLALSAGGQLSGTPSLRGEFSILFQVTDSQQRSATRLLTLVITAPPLSITTPETLPPATVSAPYTAGLSYQNGVAPVRWALGAGAPSGMTLNPTTGVLSWTPLIRGTYTFTVQVFDGSQSSASKTFTLTVEIPPLAITTVSPLFSGTVGTPYSQTFTATGGVAPYRWSAPQVVAGLSLNGGTGALSGTPTTTGTFTLTVEVRDSEDRVASRTFQLTIDPPRITIPVNAVLPGGRVGTPYQFRIPAAGGTPPYSWSLVSGTIPGLSLNTVTGVLSDTPSSAGTFSFVVQVSDSTGLSASKSFSLTIAPGPPRIQPAAAPYTATVLEPFSASLEASGGAPPYTWSANGLPDGLVIDPATGEISGSPRVAGTFPFTVRIADSARGNATGLFQLVVAFPPLPALRVSDLPETVRPATQPTLQLELSEPYAVPITGQLLLSFSPESGPGDVAVQFAAGGRSLGFTIPAGSTVAEFSAPPSIQTGTVAGSIVLTARLQSLGADIVPSPLAVQTMRVERAAPAIASARYTRSGNTIEVHVTGFSTPREVTQAVFRFSASSGTLRNSEVTLPVEEIFSRWFSDEGVVQYGSQFVFTQPFTIEGDANAVTPVSVTLTNRTGSTTAEIQP